MHAGKLPAAICTHCKIFSWSRFLPFATCKLAASAGLHGACTNCICAIMHVAHTGSPALLIGRAGCAGVCEANGGLSYGVADLAELLAGSGGPRPAPVQHHSTLCTVQQYTSFDTESCGTFARVVLLAVLPSPISANNNDSLPGPATSHVVCRGYVAVLTNWERAQAAGPPTTTSTVRAQVAAAPAAPSTSRWLWAAESFSCRPVCFALRISYDKVYRARENDLTAHGHLKADSGTVAGTISARGGAGGQADSGDNGACTPCHDATIISNPRIQPHPVAAA
jgi:hypothetical protein